MNLLEISNQYKETADAFLETSQFISVLKKYGRVEYEGAYAGNVMLNGDIDIKVIRSEEFSADEIFAAMKDIYVMCGDDFRSLYIKADWDDPRFGQQFPYGHYLGLKMFLNDEKWKCDVWFMSEAEAKRDRRVLDISKTELTEEQRKTILEFKQYRKEHSLKVSGQEIYEAVLEQGVTDKGLFFSEM